MNNPNMVRFETEDKCKSIWQFPRIGVWTTEQRSRHDSAFDLCVSVVFPPSIQKDFWAEYATAAERNDAHYRLMVQLGLEAANELKVQL